MPEETVILSTCGTGESQEKETISLCNNSFLLIIHILSYIPICELVYTDTVNKYKTINNK